MADEHLQKEGEKKKKEATFDIELIYSTVQGGCNMKCIK